MGAQVQARHYSELLQLLIWICKHNCSLFKLILEPEMSEFHIEVMITTISTDIVSDPGPVGAQSELSFPSSLPPLCLLCTLLRLQNKNLAQLGQAKSIIKSNKQWMLCSDHFSFQPNITSPHFTCSTKWLNLCLRYNCLTFWLLEFSMRISKVLWEG